MTDCWICNKLLKPDDEVVDFMGFAHFICFDNKMKANKKRMEKEGNKQ